MAAVLEHLQTRLGNAGGQLHRKRRRRQHVLPADHHKGRDPDARQQGALVAAPHDGGLLTHEAGLSDRIGHRIDHRGQSLLLQTIAMDQARQKLARDALELPPIRKRQQVAPPLAVLRPVGDRTAVEQGETRHARRRDPQDLQGHVAAHGEAGQREALRQAGEGALGHGCDAVVLGEVRDPGVDQVGEPVDLRAPEPRIAQQSREQRQDRSVVHIRRCSASVLGSVEVHFAAVAGADFRPFSDCG